MKNTQEPNVRISYYFNFISHYFETPKVLATLNFLCDNSLKMHKNTSILQQPVQILKMSDLPLNALNCTGVMSSYSFGGISHAVCLNDQNMK